DSVGAHGAHQQGVAISLGACHRLSTDVATSAITVFNDHALAELFTQVLAHDASQNIGGAACGKGHDNRNRLAGKVLCDSCGSHGTKASESHGAGQGKGLHSLAAGDFLGRHKKQSSVNI